MKQAIHPQWHDTQVSCVCGNIFTVGSTKPEIRVEICAKCHPFFTGQMRFTTAVGKVERFEKRRETAQKLASTISDKKAKKQKDYVEKENAPKSLKEMLMGLR